MKSLLRMPLIPTKSASTDLDQETFWDCLLKINSDVGTLCEIILSNPDSINASCHSYGSILWSYPVLQSPTSVRHLVSEGIPREAFFLPGSPILSGRVNPEITTFLLEKPLTCINTIPPKGLPLVAKAGTPEILNRLLDLGAKPQWFDVDGKQVFLLHHLLKQAEGFPELPLAYLNRSESKTQINVKDAQGRSPLDLITNLGRKQTFCYTDMNGKRFLEMKMQIRQKLMDMGAQ